MWIIILLIVLAVGAFAWLWYEHGFSAAWKAFAALGMAVGAAAVAFWHQIAGTSP